MIQERDNLEYEMQEVYCESTAKIETIKVEMAELTDQNRSLRDQIVILNRSNK